LLRFHALLVPAALLSASAPAQVVEEFRAPPFGSLGWVSVISGNTIVTKIGDVLYAGDISRVASEVGEVLHTRDVGRHVDGSVRIVRQPFETGGLLLTRTHLIWRLPLAAGWPRPGVFARRYEGLDFPGETTTEVSDETRLGFPVAATESHIFLRFYPDDEHPLAGHYVARDVGSLRPLGEPSPEPLRPVTPFTRIPIYGHTTDASSRYFVWQDKEPYSPERGFTNWTVYVRRTERLFDPAGEDFALDPGLGDSGFYGAGVFVDIHESLLAFVGRLASGYGIYLLDLETRGDPVPVVTAEGEEEGVPIYEDPSVSDHYVTWVEARESGVHLFGRSLSEGRLVSPPFRIGPELGQGGFAKVDRNVVIWTGLALYEPLDIVTRVVNVAELELPGADDVGDVDFDGAVTLTDALVIFNYLFLSGWRPRLRVADADGNRRLETDDAIAILNHLFLQGPRPGG
jgi:hypothetical protein